MYLSIDEMNNLMPKKEGIRFVAFKPEHIVEMENGEFHGYSTMRMVGLQDMLIQQALHGFAFTALQYGEPIAILGASLLWKGVAEMWSIIGDKAKKIPIYTTKTGIVFADICEISMGLHRLQITVKTSDTSAMSYARAIGFISEGTMCGYSEDNEDFDMMVRRM